ncbi:FAD-dependent oxidoreductase [Candidatus Micrarchaeota archaeon]|nr:FAD-dependent oxidoreductase [Candidatus Micrarchaeota archaeon]
MEKKEYTLSEKEEIFDDIKVFRFIPKDGENIRYTAGQFFKIGDAGKKEEPKFRYYSASSSPDMDYLEFAVKIVGRFTGHLDSLPINSFVQMEGPYGHFIYGGEEKSLFIGSGVGVAPLMSIIRGLKYQNKIKDAILIYGGRKTEKMPFFKELGRLEEESKGLKIYYALTGEEKLPEGCKGVLKRIDIGVIMQLVPDFRERTIYMCGHKEMLSSLNKTLQIEGLSLEKIKIERWG